MADIQYNPIKALPGVDPNRARLFYLDVNQDRDDPFAEQISDPDELRLLFQQYPFMPYSGTKQDPRHSLLATLKVLSRLSPTQNNVLNSMAFHCFGGKISAIESGDPEFNYSNDPVADAPAKEIYKALEAIKPKGGFRKLARSLFVSRKYSGEHYVIVKFYELAGTRLATMDQIDNLKIMPYINRPGEPEQFAIFDDWAKDLPDKKYEMVSAYPNFSKMKDGTLATIIQYKNTNGWRGRPEATGIMIDQFREMKDNIFLTRQSSNNFTPQAIIEVGIANPGTLSDLEKKAREANYKGLADRLRQKTTNDGTDPQSILWMEKGPDDPASTITFVPQTTNEKWFNITGGITRERIMEAHSWPAVFLGATMPTGFSQNVYLELLMVKLPLIESEAQPEEITINQAIDLCFYWTGVNVMEDKDIKFNNPYETLLKQKAESGQQQPKQPENNDSNNPINKV